ncbi:hypothetical protein NMD73_13600 [Edwardsiella tarda]|uniref:hypothetical protein n=1 Tax=Edwardsiella tarda TaxID=636 RepID=UPI00351C5409
MLIEWSKISKINAMAMINFVFGLMKYSTAMAVFGPRVSVLGIEYAVIFFIAVRTGLSDGTRHRQVGGAERGGAAYNSSLCQRVRWGV